MAAQIAIALAGLSFELRAIDDRDRAPSSADGTARLEDAGDTRGVGAAHAQHLGKELLRDLELGMSAAVLRGKEPACETRVEVVDGIAGNRLQHLGEKAVGITGK